MIETATTDATQVLPKRATGALLKDFLLAGAVTLLALGVAELSLHMCGVHFDASLFQLDPVRDYSFRPGATGWHTAENEIYVRINDAGNRDLPRSLTAAPGTFRIAVLGSSTTAALEVEQQQTYTALLERALSRPGAKVEVLNFAVEGYGAAQDFYTLHDEVWRYHPNLVIDEVSLKQYVLNCTKKYSTTAAPYPYFKVAGDHVAPDDASERIPRPTPAQVTKTNRIRTIVNHVDLLLLATEVKKQAGTQMKQLSLLHPAATAAVAPRDDPWRWTLIAPPNPEIAEGWRVLEGLMVAMRDEAAAHGAEFWVVASDDGFQINPDPQVAEVLRQKMHAANLNYGDDRFDSFLSAQHIRHIHLAPALQAYVRQTGAYLHGGPKMPPGEGHWNALGHQVVAGILAEDLKRDSENLRRWSPSNQTAQGKP